MDALDNIVTDVDAAKKKLIERATNRIAQDGYFKVSTCDYQNWDIHEHIAMQQLHRTPPNGWHISYSISWGVMDWTITNY